MDIKAFIIHLERAAGRRPQVDRLRSALPAPTDVLAAVDGRALSDSGIAAVHRPGLHRPQYPFALSRTEIACFLSHRRAWQAILDQDLDAALVVEDDATIDAAAFADVFTAAAEGLAPEELVRFPHRERHEPGPLVRARGAARLFEPRLPALGMVLQLVGRQAARRLLEASRVFDRPVDSFVQMQWLHGARILTARPIVVREICDELGGSVIHSPRTGLVVKMAHEFQRPLIRLAVHRANERWRRRAA